MLFERLEEKGVVEAVRTFDEIYRQAGGVSPLVEVSERLAAAAPQERVGIDVGRGG